MNPKSRVLNLLRKRVLILDGAMGTELQKRGLASGVCPEAWGIDHPEAVAGIHAAYREAGADIIYTATFGANRLKLGRYGLADVRGMNRSLAGIAVRAADGALVAGDIGPTGHFVAPFGDLPFEDAVALFREQALGLLEGGVDLFAIETMMDIQEARAALIAVREVCDLFCIVTMTYEPHGRTLNGTDPASALVTLQSLGADAVGCNCSAGPEGMLGLISAMKPLATVPLVAKPNAGLPKLVGDATVFDLEAEGFAGFATSLADAGVNLMGGCCGTTPAHIQALRDALTRVKPSAPACRAVVAVSSTRRVLPLAGGSPLAIAGGRLNMADNDALHQGIASGDLGPARQEVRTQEKEGAPMLLLKAGAAGLDEAATTRRLLETFAPTTRASFLLDAERVETVEQALRFYPGRLAVRAAGKDAAALLPVIAKYGAVPVIAFPAEGTRAAVHRAVADARGYGFVKEDLVIDCTPRRQDPAAFRAVPLAIALCSQGLGLRTFLDLTGIGKGLPEQPWMQAHLLAAAGAAGLTLAVLDTAVAELMQIRAAGDRLLADDPGPISPGKG